MYVQPLYDDECMFSKCTMMDLNEEDSRNFKQTSAEYFTSASNKVGYNFTHCKWIVNLIFYNLKR